MFKRSNEIILYRTKRSKQLNVGMRYDERCRCNRQVRIPSILLPRSRTCDAEQYVRPEQLQKPNYITASERFDDLRSVRC